MATPDDFVLEMDEEVNRMFHPTCVHFMLSATQWYGEWSTVIGLALMLAGGAICLDGGSAAALPMLSVGIFATATGCMSCCANNVIDENYDAVVSTEAVTFDL